MKKVAFFIGIFSIHNLAAFVTLNVDLFYAKMKEPAPEWMMEQINHDLAPFNTELSSKFLDTLFERDDLCLVRVKVSSGNISIQKSNWANRHIVAEKIIQPLLELHAFAPLPDLDFVFSAHDELNRVRNEPPLPIFIITKARQDAGFILIPDWFALKEFEPDKSLVVQGNALYPWESKSHLLFFRGGDSGIWDLRRWPDFPRPKLMKLSNEYPDLIDAKFSYLHHRQFHEYAHQQGFMGEWISMQETIQHKYLMDIDGNCAPTPRFPLLLHSNSVILKNMTDSMLWFYGTIKPYEHFIPVKENLSDLLTQLAWAKNHDEECQKISENARKLAAEVLSPESIYLYLYQLLCEYSKRQQKYHSRTL